MCSPPWISPPFASSDCLSTCCWEEWGTSVARSEDSGRTGAFLSRLCRDIRHQNGSRETRNRNRNASNQASCVGRRRRVERQLANQAAGPLIDHVCRA
jgi:hypothetical protein